MHVSSTLHWPSGLTTAQRKTEICSDVDGSAGLLADACAGGALSRIEELSLRQNRIADTWYNQ